MPGLTPFVMPGLTGHLAIVQAPRPEGTAEKLPLRSIPPKQAWAPPVHKATGGHGFSVRTFFPLRSRHPVSAVSGFRLARKEMLAAPKTTRRSALVSRSNQPFRTTFHYRLCRAQLAFVRHAQLASFRHARPDPVRHARPDRASRHRPGSASRRYGGKTSASLHPSPASLGPSRSQGHGRPWFFRSYLLPASLRPSGLRWLWFSSGSQRNARCAENHPPLRLTGRSNQPFRTAFHNHLCHVRLTFVRHARPDWALSLTNLCCNVRN